MATAKSKKAPEKKPAAKPAAKPATKPAAKPVAKPAAKPAARPAAKPVAKSAAKPAAKTSAVKNPAFSTKKTAEEVSTLNLLFDYYSELLRPRLQEVYRLYYEENLSLSEIAGTLKVTRQGVHEALKKAETELNDYEAKLGLVKKGQEYVAVQKSVDDAVAKTLADPAITSLKDKKDIDRIRRQLKKIASLLRQID
jgi:predicted DNA-binding protein YlxM (UPF0122 family)